MKRLVLLSLLVAGSLRAADCSQFDVSATPRLRFFEPQPGTDQPAIIMLTHLTPGEFEAPVATLNGNVIDVVQRRKAVPADHENCNVAVAAVQLPQGRTHLEYNWYYDAQAIASRDVDLEIESDLFTIVPPHPDATTPVSIVASGYVDSTCHQLPIPMRSGSHFDIRESCAFSFVLQPGSPRTRTAMLGLLPSGDYEARWSIEYPDLYPWRFRQHSVRFTVDPAPRRRSHGGGGPAPRALTAPIPTFVESALLLPGFADEHASLWINQSANGTKVIFNDPIVTFDGASFRVTQDATEAASGLTGYYARIDIPDAPQPGVKYPVDWRTNIHRSDGAVDVRQKSYSVEYDSFSATMEVQPLAPDVPLAAFVNISGGTFPAQPWTRIDGNTIFIDADTVGTSLETHTIAAIPPLAPGTYDVVITEHVLNSSVHRVHVPLVVPPRR